MHSWERLRLALGGVGGLAAVLGCLGGFIALLLFAVARDEQGEGDQAESGIGQLIDVANFGRDVSK